VASAICVLHCYAKHNHKETKKEKSDDAEGLEREMLIAEGVKGLVSGAQGVVKKIKVLMLVVMFQLLFLFNLKVTLDLKLLRGKVSGPNCTCSRTLGDKDDKP
jgi:hypothetical protein